MRDEDLETVMRPLCLQLLYGGKADEEEPLVIEADLTEEEKEIITQGRSERESYPESYMSLDDYIRKREEVDRG